LLPFVVLSVWCVFSCLFRVEWCAAGATVARLMFFASHRARWRQWAKLCKCVGLTMLP
jgi:hypothetical protein